MSVVTTHDPAFTVAFNGRIILTLEVRRRYGRRGRIQLSAAGLDEIRPIETYALEFSSMTNEVVDIGVKVLPHSSAPRAFHSSGPRKPGTAPSPSAFGLGPTIADWCPSGAHLRRAHTGRTAEVDVESPQSVIPTTKECECARWPQHGVQATQSTIVSTQNPVWLPLVGRCR